MDSLEAPSPVRLDESKWAARFNELISQYACFNCRAIVSTVC